MRYYENDEMTYRMYHTELCGKSIFIHANKTTREAECKVLIAKNKYTCSPLREVLLEAQCGFISFNREQHNWVVLVAKSIKEFFAAT
jgi:hypothetical protein